MEKTTITNQSEALSAVIEQYRLSLRGDHGLAHWARVLERGLKLARASGVSPHLVEVFALLHDSCRETELGDPRHGTRAVTFFRKLLPQLRIGPSDEYALVVALSLHNAGNLADDPRVAVCWDADRLDYWRIGILPDGKYMTTAIAKRIASSASFQAECDARFKQRDDQQLPAWVFARWPELVAAWEAEG
jgi:uncharacterized protein